MSETRDLLKTRCVVYRFATTTAILLVIGNEKETSRFWSDYWPSSKCPTSCWSHLNGCSYDFSEKAPQTLNLPSISLTKMANRYKSHLADASRVFSR